MAGLQCGTFGLSKNVKENKSYVHVKLTDTALKAIEEYIKSRGRCIESPSVFFQGNEGELSIPTRGLGNTKFNFTLQDADQQGSYESIKQSFDNNLESLGPMVAKMKIAAKQTDSFQMTRDRMAAETEKNSKKRARELEPINQNASNSFGRKRCRTASVHTSNRSIPLTPTIPPKEPLLPTKTSSSDYNSMTSNPFGRRRCKPVTVTSSRRNLPPKAEIPAKVPLLSSNISSSDYKRISQFSQHKSLTGGDSIACKQTSQPPIVRIPSSVKSSSINNYANNVNSNSTSKSSLNILHTGGGSRAVPQWEQPPPFDIPSYGKSHPIDTSLGSSTDSYLKTKGSDYLKEYTPVEAEALKQRRVYKNDFNQEYKTYLGLYEFIKASSYIKKVQELNLTLQNVKKGTKEYKKIEQKMMRAYKASLDDEVFQKKKNEHDDVHKKLMHIKQLVADIDITLTCGIGGP